MRAGCYGCGVKQERKGKLSVGDADRARWIQRYRASGLSLKRFAQQHGLKAGQLHYWVYLCPQSAVASKAMPTFQEVHLPAPALSGGSWSTEIGLPNGTTVRLARQTDLAWAKALVDCLRQP